MKQITNEQVQQLYNFISNCNYAGLNKDVLGIWAMLNNLPAVEKLDSPTVTAEEVLASRAE